MTKERISELLELIHQKMATIRDRDELILGHEHLAIYIAHKVGRNRFHMWPDLEGEAKLELTRVINKIFIGKKELYNNELGRVLTKNIAHRCKDHIEKYGFGISMPGRTFRLKLEKGIEKKLSPKLIQSDLDIEKKVEIAKIPTIYQDKIIQEAKNLTIDELKQIVRTEIAKLLPIPKVFVAVADWPEPQEEREYTRNKSGNFANILVGIYKVPFGVPIAKRTLSSEMKELLEKAASTPLEQAIMNMRAQGYTYEEIGPKVGMSFNSVCSRVNDMAKRFDYYYSR